MANRCENVLRVSGNYRDLMRFDSKFRAGKENREKNYHFDHLYPTPNLPICETAQWRQAHWGVKGNFYEETFARDIIRDGDIEIYYYFETPSIGPELLIQRVSKDFPDMEFMLVYREDGNDIGGINVYRDGNGIMEYGLTAEEKKYWFGEEERLEVVQK